MMRDDLYTDLWKLCAGPLVDVPKLGELVYYFPQGHMEQVSTAATNYFYRFILLLPAGVAVYGL